MSKLEKIRLIFKKVKRKVYKPFLKAICIRMILFYQRNISLHTCRFHPTCSQYTLEAINNYGVILGILMGTWRILRCNPLTKAGTVEFVPEKWHKLKWLI